MIRLRFFVSMFGNVYAVMSNSLNDVLDVHCTSINPLLFQLAGIGVRGADALCRKLFKDSLELALAQHRDPRLRPEVPRRPVGPVKFQGLNYPFTSYHESPLFMVRE